MKFLIGFSNIVCIVILYFLFKISNYNDFVIQTTNKQFNTTGATLEMDDLQSNTITYILIIVVFTLYGCIIGTFSNYFILRYLTLIGDEENNYNSTCSNLVDWYKDLAFIFRNGLVLLILICIILAVIFHYDLFLIYVIFVGITAALGLSTWVTNLGEKMCKIVSKILCCHCCKRKTRY